MTRIDLHQIPIHTQLAHLHQGRPARKRYGHDGFRLVETHHVLHELVIQQNVAVYNLYVLEPVPEPGPPAEIVDAQDLGTEAEPPGQLGHVKRRRPQERAHLDYGSGLDPADEVLEHRSLGAPPFDPRATKPLRRVLRREIVERRRSVEEAVEERRAH